MREHSNCSMREQSGRKRQKGETEEQGVDRGGSSRWTSPGTGVTRTRSGQLQPNCTVIETLGALRTNIPWRDTAPPPCPAQSTLGGMDREVCLGCWAVIETGEMIGEGGVALLRTVIRATHQLPSTTTTALALPTTTMTHTTQTISVSTGRIRTECLRAVWVMVGMTGGTPLLPVRVKGIIIMFLVTKSCILEEQLACLQPYLGLHLNHSLGYRCLPNLVLVLVLYLLDFLLVVTPILSPTLPPSLCMVTPRLPPPHMTPSPHPP